jgi:nucleoside-diphosphate-sugar epimerase
MLDITRAEKEFGFKAKTSLETGLRRTIECFLAKKQEL